MKNDYKTGFPVFACILSKLQRFIPARAHNYQASVTISTKIYKARTKKQKEILTSANSRAKIVNEIGRAHV